MKHEIHKAAEAAGFDFHRTRLRAKTAECIARAKGDRAKAAGFLCNAALDGPDRDMVRSMSREMIDFCLDGAVIGDALVKNDGEDGQIAHARDGHVAVAVPPSPQGDGKGQPTVASNGQIRVAHPSPTQRDGRGHDPSAGNGHPLVAPPSPSLRGAGAKTSMPQGHRLLAPAAAKPAYKPGHTKRGSVVIALKNEEIKKTILDTYMIDGKALGDWRLRELPNLFTGNYERATVVRLIYDRNHNRDQSLTVKEVEDADDAETLIKSSHKEAVRTFRREGDMLAAG